MNKVKIMQAVEALKKDDVCIFPADTVYGLFCRAKSPRAAAKINKIKGRSEKKPLQLFLSDKKDIFKYALVTSAVKSRINALLPGPYTLVLKLKPAYKDSFSFLKTGTAGFRVIDSEIINGIIRELHEPIAATSANVSGKTTPVKYKDIDKAVLAGVKLALKDDRSVKGKASSVLDLTVKKEKILRA
jgi:L-threonylcarbamoyladenylate synthase